MADPVSPGGRVVAIANGKGGVGKTSITANLAGTAAAGGWRVLAVDLDPQGNLARDLGYHADSDQGEALAAAVEHQTAVVPMAGVRERLDVVAGGHATEDLELRLRASGPDQLARAITSATDPYDLVLLDCPPATGILLDAALHAARWLLIPTRGDAASLDGLARVARRFATVRDEANPDLELLGVILFNFGIKDTATVAAARAQIAADLAGAAPVLTSFIRNSRKAPDDMRELGLIACEYEETAATAPRWFIDRTARRYSRSAGGLAEDYQALTDEILSLLLQPQATP